MLNKLQFLHRRIIASSILILILSMIPPLLAINTFFRVDDLSSLVLAKTYFPDFTFKSFTALIQHPLYEYYRPVAMIIWWIAYMLGGIDPEIYHILSGIFFGLISVNIFLIGRFQTNELTGWLSVLVFMTFSPVIITSWWISNFGVGFGGMLFFTSGILGFLYLSSSPRILFSFSILAFTFAFFAKNSFVFLAPVPLLFSLINPTLRDKLRIVFGGIVILISGASVIIARIMVGGTAINAHVHLNLLELPLALILQNLSDYWGLLMYGHSPFIVVLGIFYASLYNKRRIPNYWILAFLFALIWITMKWSIIVQCIGALGILLIIFEKSWNRKIWIFWMGAGLAQVMFWDVRVLGGLLVRFILESSVGYALLIGYGLAGHLSSVVDFLKHQARNPRSGWLSAQGLITMVVCLYLLAGSYHGASYIIPTLKREFKDTAAQSSIIKDTIGILTATLPQKAQLYCELPLIAGVEHYSQLDHALIDFDRDDIRTHYYERSKLFHILQDDPSIDQTLYVLSDHVINTKFPAYRLTQEQGIEHGSYRSYIYRLDSVSR